MGAIKHLHRSIACWPGVMAITAALCWTGASWADRFPPDPVEALSQDLKTLTPTELMARDADLAKRLEALEKSLKDNPTELEKRKAQATEEAHEKLLNKRIDSLRSLGQMRRALLLQGWLEELFGEQKGPLVRSQNYLADRFRQETRRVLQQGSLGSRLAALTILAEIGVKVRTGDDRNGIGRAFTPDLVELVKHGSTPQIRATAARTLGQVYPVASEAAPALGELLTSGTLDERRAAGDALLSMVRMVYEFYSEHSPVVASKIVPEATDVVAVGQAVVPAASPGLKDADAEVRRLSTAAIGQVAFTLYDLVPHPRGPGEITVGSDRTERERRQSEGASPRVLRPLTVVLRDQAPTLSRAVSDPDLEVRLLARRTLEDMGSARRRLLRLAASVNSAPETRPPVDEVPPDNEPSKPTRQAPPDKGQAGAPENLLLEGLQVALPALQAGVADADVRARRAAIDVLETLGPAAAPAAPALIKALADPDRFVRWAAARTLGATGPVESASAVPALARLLRDQDLDLSMAAARALESFGPAAKAAVGDLIKSLTASDAEMRKAAMRALVGIGTDARPAIPALSATLVEDQDPRVRQLAAEVLSKFGDKAKEAEPALRRALRDSDPDVRKAASDALLDIEQNKR